MTAVIFVDPESPGNIGSLARVMKNFGLKELYLVGGVDPNLETRMMAMNAYDVVQRSKRITMEQARKKFSQLVATTANVGCEFNVNRSWITVDKLKVGDRSAIVLGRESKGLTNEEMALCDAVVTIPADKGYPTLNITHAAAIIFYELFKHKRSLRMASPGVLGRLRSAYDGILPKVGVSSEKIEVQRKIFKRLLGKSVPTEREATGLLGVLNRINKRLA